MQTAQKETPTSGSNHAAGVNTFNTAAIVTQSPAADKLFATLQARAALGGIILARSMATACNAWRMATSSHTCLAT